MLHQKRSLFLHRAYKCIFTSCLVLFFRKLNFIWVLKNCWNSSTTDRLLGTLHTGYLRFNDNFFQHLSLLKKKKVLSWFNFYYKFPLFPANCNVKLIPRIVRRVVGRNNIRKYSYLSWFDYYFFNSHKIIHTFFLFCAFINHL